MTKAQIEAFEQIAIGHALPRAIQKTFDALLKRGLIQRLSDKVVGRDRFGDITIPQFEIPIPEKYGPHLKVFGALSESFRMILNQISEFKSDYDDGHLSGPFKKSIFEFLEWHKMFAEHVGAVRFYGDHMNYMQQAIKDARDAFNSSFAEKDQ